VKAELCLRAAHDGFVEDEIVLGQDRIGRLWFSPYKIIPLFLHTRLPLCDSTYQAFYHLILSL
jgi:hypothetical protein